MSRVHAFVFTINNHTFDDLLSVISLDCSYLVFGFEFAPTTNTPHIQGYVRFVNNMSLKAFSKLLPRAGSRVAKAGDRANYVYCTKSGDWYQFGDTPMPGKRTDLDSLVEMIDNGSSREEIQAAYPKYYFMYKKKIEDMVKPTVNEHRRFMYIIPESKKYEYPGAFLCDTSMDLDCYQGEDVVIIDCYNVNSWINWVHGFPMRVKRGYEIVIIDPTILYVIYRDNSEYKYLLKYSDYIDYANKGDENVLVKT